MSDETFPDVLPDPDPEQTLEWQEACKHAGISQKEGRKAER